MPQESLFTDQTHGAGAPGGAVSPTNFPAFVRVSVERSIGDGAGGSADGALTYGVPAGIPLPAIGRRVLVPLGRGKKPLPGIVVAAGGAELLEGLAPHRVKAIIRVDPGSLPETLVKLAVWLGEYYVTPLGMVLGTMIPGAVKHAAGKRTLSRVHPTPGFDPTPLKRQTRATHDRILALPPSMFPLTPVLLAKQLGMKSPAAIKRLVAAGALTVETVDVVHVRALDEATGAPPQPSPQPPQPTPAQARTIGAISASLGAFSVHLLEGVTGSGKTEVYLRLIQRVLDAGNSAIVLVPEISLTPQTAARFTQRFGAGTVAILHSGLRPAQRHAAWAACEAGTVRVVVGARSCVFAPLRSPGIIVVDEEHDSGYKQDQLPRYHARDAAIKRAQLENCTCLLGSATPSLESWSNAQPGPTGAPARFSLHRLTERVGGATLPRVQIVDMAQERRLGGAGARDPRRAGLIGPTLEHAMDRTLREDGQVILLLNRRGFAHRLACPSSSCGFVLSCDRCDSCLVLHTSAGNTSDGLVRCHHCLSEQRVPRTCPTCGTPLLRMGAGTQRLEDEVHKKFAALGIAEGSTMLRIDSDTMRHARDYERALGAFGRGEVRVLLGTQMIAKGLDYPNVRLVGVVDADTALALPDFRAEERTFQLVSQVAGRAGRGSAPGLTIVQTHSPRNPAIVLAAAHDYTSFAQREVITRRNAGLPPSTRLARIVCRDKDPLKARHRAEEVADALMTEGGSAASVSPATECTVARIDEYWRWETRVIAPDAGVLRRMLTRARRAGLLQSDARTAVDVDPVSLL